MLKKFFSAIIIVFAFLFLNMSINSVNVKAEDDIFANAGFGEKKNYWAIANYGEDYVGSEEIVIDIQKEAVADPEVNFIAIVESEYAGSELVYYERNVHPGFSSRIKYTLQNKAYGEKYITILLLRELVTNPSDNLIVDKIIIGINHKRNISNLTEEDISIIQEIPNDTQALNPYKVNVTLNSDSIEGNFEDYVLKSVKYTLLNSPNSSVLNALYESTNNFYFTVYQNGTYEVEVEDIFGYTIKKTVEITNLVDPDIIIQVNPSETGYTNHDYEIGVQVIYYLTGNVLNSSELKSLEVSFNGNTSSIKENMSFIVKENGLYIINAETNNGSKAELMLQIDNIDKESPYLEVASTLVVYTESVHVFTPENEVFYYDNMTIGENIKLELTYYTVKDGVKHTVFTGDVKNYLYTVRDLIIRYKVSDEAGNSVEKDTYVQSIDNTKPTIAYSIDRSLLYINDPYPTNEEIETAYEIKVSDNSLYEGSNRKIDYSVDFSELPVDNNQRLNKLGEYRIFVNAVDEAGNESEAITLKVEVRARLIKVEADQDLYIVYGDEMIELTYHCVTRDGENVPCEQELLEGDAIIGELYVLNAYYTGVYNIYYDKIDVPSELYYLEYGRESFFTIKQRTIRVVADDKSKDYLDPEPELTYRIDDVCSNPTEQYKDYRCSLVEGDTFDGNIVRDMTEPSEDVWYDEAGNVLPRRIMQGTLYIKELFNGGVDNYVLEFVEGKFWIYPKDVQAYIEEKEKIYGEEDPEYTLKKCVGKPPIEGMTASECMIETRITLYRETVGETVVLDEEGNYIDYYMIVGEWTNRNYIVTFHNEYLTIKKRNISISVVGDLDEEGNPTGKHTIYYEDEIPDIKVYDSSTGASSGLVDNQNLSVPIKDSFYYGKASIYSNCNGTCEEFLVEDYVDGIGLYIIKKGSITIVDMNGLDAESNYNITFNNGTLEVIKKQIWIKIIKDLSKIYGDDDRIFTASDLEGYSDYVILEANGRYIIEITPTTLEDEEPYIPRDNYKMKYHLNREEGIYVGLYNIFIELLEGCENYEVNLFKEYKFEILKRDVYLDIDSQTIIYRDAPKVFTYDQEKAESTLQYNDYLTGNPEAEEFHNVGKYKITVGTIRILNEFNEDVSFNYQYIVEEGILTIVQREVMIEVRENQGKQYGENDPELLFNVYHKGVREEMPKEDYTGSLGREEGEIPGYYYKINMGTLEITLRGEDEEGNPLGNYLIYEFNNNNEFYISKRDITVKARDVTAIYGNEYEKEIVFDTNGGLAYNEALKIDGFGVYDILVGELKILGEVDGVGTYTISCEDIRIVRRYTLEDVTEKYYNYSYENGTLEILPRIIQITPDDGQYKLYGDNDTGITFTYTPDLLMETDEFSGELKRIPRIVNDVEVTEEVGEYTIGLGTLTVNKNYELVLNGTKTFVIIPRKLNIVANDITIYYGDEFELTYSIEGDGLANNEELGIVDTISGELNLDREYTGYGRYNILGDNLVISNVHNYNYTFTPGLLIVHKRIVTVTPSEKTLYKIYGEADPEYFEFTLDVSAAYTGELTRVEGDSVGKYRILIGTLDFGPNYDVILEEAYFTIIARVIEVNAINTGKIYGSRDPVLEYTYVGTLIGNDTFFGSLTREAGEEVGDYAILQGSLTITNNYTIKYTPAVFSIRYAEFTDINIYSLTNNPYQVKGEEEEVRLYARFNDGADETNIGDTVWTVSKVVGNGETTEWEFTKDINNIVSFTPSGSVGKYIITASYGGKSDTYEVVVEVSTVGNVYIRYVAGEINQILGKESELTYMVIVPDTATSDANVQWLVNGNTIQINKVTNTYFFYTPNLGKGEYKVQARIGNKVSEPLYFYVNNNNPPVITLNGDPVVYIEAKTDTKYIELGATVIDDIDGDITSSLRITGYVNTDVKGTYYIKYDATDSHGNNAISMYRQVVVRDTTPPVVTLNGNKEIVLLYGQEYIEYGASAIDNYDGEVDVTINNPIVIDKIGSYEVSYIAYDESGNRGIATRHVEIIDNISPLITLIGDEIIYIEVYENFEDPGALIQDNVDGEFIISATSFYYGSEVVDAIDTGRLGTYYARYDYTDSAGNIGAGQIRTIIVRDTTAPVITLNGTNPYIIRYAYPDLNYVEPGAIAKDNYDKEVPVTITGQLGSDLGTYYLYYDAVDSNGNIAKTVTRQVIVVDVQNPIIHFYDRCPQYITIEALYEEYDIRCDSPGYGLWVEDDYQSDLEELQKRVVVKGTVDNTTIGTYVISYDVKDMAGNSAITLNRYVTVVDTTAPVLSLIGGDENGDQIVEVFEEYIELGASVYDRYDEYHNLEIEIIINHNVNVNKLGEYFVTYNATDSNGNKAIPITRKVSVKDTTPPVITLLGDNPMTIERGLSYVEYGATAIDNYDGPMRYITIINAPSGMKLGTYEVIYRAIDSSGNIGEAIRVVNVVDTIPPIVLGVEDGMYYKNPVSIYFIPTLGTDEVLTGWLNGEEITSPYYLEEDGEYDLLVRDDAGNETKIWFAIDTTEPLILGVRHGEYTNRDVEVYSNEKIKYYEYRYQSGDWVRSEEQRLLFTREGTYRIYAVDMAGNTSSVILFHIDKTPPTYSLSGVINKGITNTDVILTAEEGTSVIVNAHYNIPTLYTFRDDGYYQVAIRDLAGNTVNLQFVINKTLRVTVNDKIISILSQHNAIDKVSINGTRYPRNSGYMIVKPLLEGGFEYVSGKLFSEAEYQKLLAGETLEFGVSSTDDTYMFVGFVVTADELNKFETQTVDEEDDDNFLTYLGIAAFIFGLFFFFFIFFIKKRKKEEEEDEEEETIVDDY